MCVSENVTLVCISYVVTSRIWTLICLNGILQQRMGIKNNMCYNGIRICAQMTNIILDSIVNTIGGPM